MATVQSMAGQGETYSHVGAVFLLDGDTNVHFRDQMPCISKESTWIETTALKDIPYLMLKDIDIDFTTAKK